MLRVIGIFFVVFQFPIISQCNGYGDVILSPKDFGGKYAKFNRLVDTTSKVPWEDPLKESAKLALSSPKISKDAIQRAPYVGFKLAPSSFGDIVVLAKGKLKRLANNSYVFEQINDICEYECQNNAEKYLENVTALYMIERIRHRDHDRGYRFDLKFTIVPIFNEAKHPYNKTNNLEERLKHQLKKTYILRDTDYPKYFLNVTPKLTRRADSIDRSISTFMHPNNLMHSMLGFTQPPKIFQIAERLNTGEYYRKTFAVPKSVSNNFYIPNVSHRYPVRFPDSREGPSPLKNPYRMKIYKEEEKQEAHVLPNIIDHRGAVDLNKPLQHANNVPKPPPPRNQNLFVPQPAIAVPLLVSQMPMSLFTIPVHLQVSTPSNQLLYPQNDITTFRYPVPPFSDRQIPYIPLHYPTFHNKSNVFRESERISSTAFSPRDPIYHQSTTERPIFPTMYTPKLSNYVTASSIQINTYDNDFKPIESPYSKLNSTKGSAHNSNEKNRYGGKNAEQTRTRHASTANERREKLAKVTTAEPLENDANYDVVATRPSVTKRTTEKPILKWLPKKYRNKTSIVASSTVKTTATSHSLSTSTESVNIQNTHPTRSSTHAQQIFRGRNRFYKRNYTTPSVTEKSTTTLSSVPNQTLKLLKRKVTTTTLLPVTTPSPFIITSTTVFPTYVVTSPYVETNEPVTQQSYSTSISFQIDDSEKYVDSTSSSYELIPAGVESIKSNSSNIKIYKASVVPEIDVNEKLKIDDVAASILNHAKAFENRTID